MSTRAVPKVLTDVLIDVGGNDFGVSDGVLLPLVDLGVQGGHIDVLDFLAKASSTWWCNLTGFLQSPKKASRSWRGSMISNMLRN